MFEDPQAITIDDPHPDEDRYVTIGLDFLGCVVKAREGRIIDFDWTGRVLDVF